MNRASFGKRKQQFQHINPDSSYVKSSLAIIQVFPNALQRDMAEWPVLSLFYTNNQLMLG